MGCTMNLQRELPTMSRRTSVLTSSTTSALKGPTALSSRLEKEKVSIKIQTNNESILPDEIFNNESILHQVNSKDDQLPIWAQQAKDEIKTLQNIEYSNGNDDMSSDSDDFTVNDLALLKKNFKSEHDMIDTVVRSNQAHEIDAQDITFHSKIGHGAFGAVYKAKWEGNTVVVKQFNNSSLKEMMAEILVASSLPTHHNLVTIYGYMRNPFGCVMSYMSGDSVEKYVYRKYKQDTDPLPTIVELIIILRKAACGLKFLHSNGVVHRDIACRNILLGKIVNGVQLGTEVKISDFGLMRVTAEKNCSGKTESKFGPVRWMAPESIRRQEYSKKSDVYMFGMTMYEIFYGIEPWNDEVNTVQVAINVSYKEMRPKIRNNNCKMPPGYLKLMQLCWKQLPKQRLSFKEIVNSFNELETNLLNWK